MFRPSSLRCPRLDLVAVGDLVGQVLELAGDAGGDHRALAREQFGGGRARRDHSLFRFGGIAV